VNINTNHFIIRRSKFVLFGGLFCALVAGVFIVLMTIFPSRTPPLLVYLLFTSVFIVFMSIVILWFTWRIKVQGDKIYYRKMFGGNKEVTFDMT